MNFLDALSVRTHDYVAVVNSNKDVVDTVSKTAKAVVSVNSGKLQNIKLQKNLKGMDSVFDKILVKWQSKTSIPEIINSCENLGMILLCNIDLNEKKKVVSEIVSLGMFDYWVVEQNKKRQNFNLLFKVKKHNNPHSRRS